MTFAHSWRVTGCAALVLFHFGGVGSWGDQVTPPAPAGLRIVSTGNTNASQRTAGKPDASNAPGRHPEGTADGPTKSAASPWALPPALAPGPDALVIPVLVISFFPTNGGNIDIRTTGDVGEPLPVIEEKTRRLTREICAALQEGSRYRAYADPTSRPALSYKLAGSIDFFEALPTKKPSGPEAPMTDYHRILERIGIRDWVENMGVKEVWIWGYHGGKVGLWESNMSSPYGDVSNSDCDTNDLPVLRSTYTVYHYNYQRGASEAVEDHMHQIEALLNYVDGRHLTPPDRWSELLFWGKFVGSDKSHHIVHPGCGWAHYPPNGQKDYDWANHLYVQTDMDDWKPDGTGRKTRLNCERWGSTSLGWFICWMQHLPGPGNDLVFQGKPLNNWWVFVGDWDLARRQALKLVRD